MYWAVRLDQTHLPATIRSMKARVRIDLSYLRVKLLFFYFCVTPHGSLDAKNDVLYFSMILLFLKPLLLFFISQTKLDGNVMDR